MHLKTSSAKWRPFGSGGMSLRDTENISLTYDKHEICTKINLAIYKLSARKIIHDNSHKTYKIDNDILRHALILHEVPLFNTMICKTVPCRHFLKIFPELEEPNFRIVRGKYGFLRHAIFISTATWHVTKCEISS